VPQADGASQFVVFNGGEEQLLPHGEASPPLPLVVGNNSLQLLVGLPNRSSRCSTAYTLVRPPSSAITAATLPRFDAGMMFGCKRDTFDENMSRHLFGLPASHFRTAQQITDATALFLFNYSTRQLYGVFLRDGPAAMDIEPQAWAHHRKPGASQSSSPYPAQVRWKVLKKCNPIHENLWRDVPTTKMMRGGSQPIYELFMNAQQARRLAELCFMHG